MLRVLAKNGKSDKPFCRQAAAVTHDLYLSEFGPELPVTEGLVGRANVRYVFWAENPDGRVIAASMVKEISPNYVRILGLAVSEKRQGHGTAIMRKIEATMPSGTEIELGVDLNKDTTDFLLDWYKRLGYSAQDQNSIEIIMRKRV